MASSTTRPMASTSASKVRELMENPNKAIKAKLPVSDTGMVINGMMEARNVRKKKKITKDTKAAASRMVA